MIPATARILDANANRAREALRVLEDYARLGLNDASLAGSLKNLRHGLAAALSPLDIQDALCARDTPGDVGTVIKTEAELRRASLAEVVIAAGKRLSEALRVLEEIAKTTQPAAAAQLETLRYQGYSIEQALTRAALQAGRFAQVCLYVLLTEALCRRPWEETLDAIIAGWKDGCAGRDGMGLAIQLREKSLPDGELLRRARLLVERCRAGGGSGGGVIPVINDRPDIALLAGAGVHLGQGDLPAAEVRRLVGHEMVVGVSTENLTQAQEAVRQGATYVGVGPMFPTSTKEKPQIVGPAYAQEAVANLPVPCVAIGGITLENLPQLMAVGVRCVAVCAAIITTDDP
ncbi:MAG: thiamine phosphate synthase, partial [Phycisphaerae bacterium]